MITTPPPLRKGDKIAIVSPAGTVRPEYVEGACRVLADEGYEPVVMAHALGRHGAYSGKREERLSDMAAALSDPRVRAVVCSRGGHGCMDIISGLDAMGVVNPGNAKWLLGFSDITYLHALWLKSGVASLHCSNAKGIAQGRTAADTAGALDIIAGKAALPADGTPCVGGNLSIVASLVGTPFDMIGARRCNLFIEDLNEPLYKIERALWQILTAHAPRIDKLLIGDFIDIRYNSGDPDVIERVCEIAAEFGIAIERIEGLGHGQANRPMIEGIMNQTTR